MKTVISGICTTCNKLYKTGVVEGFNDYYHAYTGDKTPWTLQVTCILAPAVNHLTIVSVNIRRGLPVLFRNWFNWIGNCLEKPVTAEKLTQQWKQQLKILRVTHRERSTRIFWHRKDHLQFIIWRNSKPKVMTVGDKQLVELYLGTQQRNVMHCSVSYLNTPWSIIINHIRMSSLVAWHSRREWPSSPFVLLSPLWIVEVGASAGWPIARSHCCQW